MILKLWSMDEDVVVAVDVVLALSFSFFLLLFSLLPFFIELVDEDVDEADDGEIDELSDEQLEPTPPFAVTFVFMVTMARPFVFSRLEKRKKLISSAKKIKLSLAVFDCFFFIKKM